MRLNIESTTKLVDLVPAAGGPSVPARIWEGLTESGIPVHCYITRVAVRNDADTEQFERELIECKAPSPAVAALDARLIL